MKEGSKYAFNDVTGLAMPSPPSQGETNVLELPFNPVQHRMLEGGEIIMQIDRVVFLSADCRNTNLIR